MNFRILKIVGCTFFLGLLLPLNSISQSKISGSLNGHDYVDLGLPSGVKWATCNLGANYADEYGNYFTWGDVIPTKAYPFGLCDMDGINFIIGNGIDLKTKQLKTIDAVHHAWGNPWRMPTWIECRELVQKCNWEWTNIKTRNGNVNGYVVTGPNGNSIFLPAAGLMSRSGRYLQGEFGIYLSNCGKILQIINNEHIVNDVFAINFHRTNYSAYYTDGRAVAYTIRGVAD